MLPLANEDTMEKSSGGSPPSKLSEKLDQRLTLYALAASATGVSLLALTPAAEARIVYTKTHQVIGLNSLYGLDLNHDGTIDFLIEQWGRFSGLSNALVVKEAYGNAVQGYGGPFYYGRFASALRQGARIGPHQPFVRSGFPGEIMVRYFRTQSSRTSTLGQWKNLSSRYVGLKFKIDGKTHYGWARLSVRMKPIIATLTGYAYETVPDKAILAGQTGNEASDSTNSLDSANAKNPQSGAVLAEPQSATLPPETLGMLARGAPGVPPRRHP